MATEYGQLERTEVPVTGLACGGGGARTVERVLGEVEGVASAYVNTANETAYVAFDPARCTKRHIRERLAGAGYLPWDAV